MYCVSDRESKNREKRDLGISQGEVHFTQPFPS